MLRIRGLVALEGVFDSLSCVLDFLAGLLEVCLRLLADTLGLQVPVAGGFAGLFLDLAACFFGGITNLVTQSHGFTPRVSCGYFLRLSAGWHNSLVECL